MTRSIFDVVLLEVFRVHPVSAWIIEAEKKWNAQNRDRERLQAMDSRQLDDLGLYRDRGGTVRERDLK